MAMIDLGSVQGANGYSPVITLEQDQDMLTITVTDVNGTQTKTIRTVAFMGSKNNLLADADLNDVKTEGLYTARGDALAATLTNAPVTTGFLLECWRPTNSEDAVVQRVTGTSGETWCRSYLTGIGWNAWKQMVNMTQADERYPHEALTDNEIDGVFEEVQV